MEGQTVDRSVGQHDEREGKGRGVITLTISHTDQVDRLRERDSWRDAEQLLTIVTGRTPE